MEHSYQAILLIAFGGPTRPAEIWPFLARVTKGVPIPAERVEEVARHYEAVGGKSPLNAITFRQAEALETALKDCHRDLPVYVGMRNSRPFFDETLKRMADDGIKRALGVILSSHRSEASWERYQKNISDAQAELGTTAPQVDYCGGWHDHPLFIQTWADSIQAVVNRISPDKRQTTPLVFTAHSLPLAMAAQCDYVTEVTTSARLIAAKTHHPRWSIAYQSRSGKPSDPWLEPDIVDAIRDLAAKGNRQVIVAPIGFVSDHVEVLYDLDIEALTIAAELGMEMLRAGCPNDQTMFIRMMAAVVDKALKDSENRG